MPDSLRSGLDLDLVDVECDEDWMGERSAAGSPWAHPSPCGKDESTEASMVVAVVGGVGPPTDWLGNVVMPTDEAGGVHVEVCRWEWVWTSGGKLTSMRRHCSPASDQLSPSVMVTPSRVRSMGVER